MSSPPVAPATVLASPLSGAAPLDAAPRAVFATLSLAMLLSSLGTSIANVGLPALAQAFDAPFAAVQWIVIAYLAANTALVVIAGRLGDRFGRRRGLLGGLLLFGVASALCAAAPSLPWLIAARALQGSGAAAMMAMALALVGDVVPKSHSGRAMGLLGTMSAVGTALGPSLGGLLVAGFGWRALFAATLPLAGLAALLARRALPADRPAARVAAVPMRVLLQRDARLRAGIAMSALVSSVMMATLVVGPFHLSRALGLQTVLVGLAMAVGPVVSALAGVPAGRVVDRFGAHRASLLGLAAATAACMLLAAMPLRAGLVGYVGPLMLLTAGYALFQAANNTAVLADVTPAQRGTVSGLLGLSRNLGLVAGASGLGAVFALAVGPAPQAAAPAAVAAGLQLCFVVASGLVGLALLIGWRARPARG
ncbi:MFS transporter [Aquabacterium humicola]|uniref:MFS transporter n=1 Tax=Aquabacterium humicola TaxID=3237377 RepID=UPI0025439748|nr:MFS transporter [Rubrivivax pictus]